MDSSCYKWTVLKFNFPHLLRKYINREYSHTKSIKLCANMFVKNVFSTSKPYNPNVADKKTSVVDEITNSGDEPFTREMRYPVPSGHVWSEFYQYIKFPSTSENLSVSIKDNLSSKQSASPSFVLSRNGKRIFRELPIVRNNASNHSIMAKAPKLKKASEKIEDDFHNMSLIENVAISSFKDNKKKTSKAPPFCELRTIVGFGPCRKVEFSRHVDSIYYAAGAVMIRQYINKFKQTKFTGHSDSILTFAVDDHDEYMASSQKDSPLIRIWLTSSKECIALIKSADEPCGVLEFSKTDKALLGVTFSRPKSKLILWDTSLLKLQGDISIICEGVCNDALIRGQLSSTTSQKIATCSSRSVQIWRLKTGKLKSCTISTFMGLEHVLQDLRWGSPTGNSEHFIYVATASGVIIELDSTKAAVSRCIDICTIEDHGVKSINSIAIHNSFALSGTGDGSMKVWDPGFKDVILNVEHESAVTNCAISFDGLKLLAVTETDSIGILDATTKAYTTILTSHSKK